MDRVKGLLSFAVIAAVVLVVLRGLHVAVPVLFPSTRQGPIAVASLDEARKRVGFAPIVPAYHPSSLGATPTSISVLLSPEPSVIVVWRQGSEYLSVVQRRGGPEPEHPPLAQPLADVPDSTWWMADSQNHLVLWRVGYWIEIATSLPARDLKRFADTLTQQ
jgi:hypothetical protein